MILSSHIIAASVVSKSLLKKPFGFINAIFIFLISFASHYILDAIPHWDYKLNSFVRIFDGKGVYGGEKKFIFQKNLIIRDLLKNSADGIIGLLAEAFIIGMPKNFNDAIIFCLIAFGAILPDAMQIIHCSIKNKRPKILELEHKIHVFFHSEKKFFKIHYIFGIVFQIFILSAIIVFSKLLL